MGRNDPERIDLMNFDGTTKEGCGARAFKISLKNSSGAQKNKKQKNDITTSNHYNRSIGFFIIWLQVSNNRRYSYY